jgi:uncharacterized repeat protein (TIGR03806 family)
MPTQSLDAGAPQDAGVTQPAEQHPADCGTEVDGHPGLCGSGLNTRPSAAVVGVPDALEIAAPGWTAVDAYPNLTFVTPVSFSEAPGTGHVFVAEREGRVYAFANDPAATEKQLVLDLSDRNQGEQDGGLMGMVFHPEFGFPGSPNRGYIYFHYAYNPNVVGGVVPHPDTVTHSRLARFTVDLATLTITPASELVLIDQLDGNIWHQGGAMFFHPENGFLYLSVGDEGTALCGFGNCQRIDKDLFSGVLRIDVDMRGDNVSHPILRQPQTGTTANYYIPNDNPFVGQEGVLEEFYALGLRSPHRMTHDSIDNITWIGEVGESSREELNVLLPAANYQWAVMEGTRPSIMPMPTDPIGVWTEPVVELLRDEAASIIGGYVYRGSRLPYLYGKYVFGDFVTGNIWALSYSSDGQRATALQRELLMRSPFRASVNGITSFGVDLNNELYILTFGDDAKIYRLDRTTGFSNAPLHLSETGVFTDTGDLELDASPGFVPYDVRSPLWSDGARKRRWVSVPDGQSVGFSETESWSFPVGTVFVKHFELALDESRPDQVERLETRLLVHGSDSEWYGVTYRWNDMGTDADLVFEGQTEPIDVALADGSTRRLQYYYPGPGDCGVCHNAFAGSVLGARTSQLNHNLRYSETGRVANQVYTWGEIGLLDVALDEAAVHEMVSLASPTDVSADLEDRVRSYWAANCSMCHGTVPGMRANWDARYESPLAEQGVVLGPSESNPSESLVVPGDPESSVLYLRSVSTVPGDRMPPMGRSAADPAYVDLLEQWIHSLN